MPARYDRLRALIRNDNLLLGILGIAVGCLAGVGTVAFRTVLEMLWSAGHGGSGLIPAEWLVYLPMAGAAVVAVATAVFYPKSGPFGVERVVEASALKGGRFALRDGLFMAGASVVGISSGGSLGREGPAIVLGSALGSAFSRWLKLPRGAVRILLASGAGAAVSASFGAPIAGALFAHEVVLGTYALTALVPVVLASVSAMAVALLLLGPEAGFTVASLSIEAAHIPLYAALGLACGLLASLYMHAIGWVRTLAAKVKIPLWGQPFIAGAMVSLAVLYAPLTLGSGAEAIQAVLDDSLTALELLHLLGAKLFLTVLCLGLAFWGGVFTPALALGALFGALFGVMAQAWAPVLASDITGYALVGMGAVSASVLGAPVSTTFIIFELTGSYAASAMTLLAVVLSTSVSRHLVGHRSFFLLRLKQLGLDLEDGRDVGSLSDVQARALMEPPPVICPPDMPLKAVVEACSEAREPVAYVVDGEGAYLGVVPLAHAAATALEAPQTRADEALEEAALSFPPDLSLARVVSGFGAHGHLVEAPVIDDSGEAPELLGIIRHAHALTVQRDLYRELLWEESGGGVLTRGRR